MAGEVASDSVDMCELAESEVVAAELEVFLVESVEKEFQRKRWYQDRRVDQVAKMLEVMKLVLKALSIVFKVKFFQFHFVLFEAVQSQNDIYFP